MGLCYYTTPYNFLQAKIKWRKDSFYVEELINLDLVQEDGEYFLYKIYKPWGITTESFTQRLRKFGAFPLGRKDKYSKARVYIISKRRLPSMKNLCLIGKLPQDIKMDEIHIGNRFRISVYISGVNVLKSLNDITCLIEEINEYQGKNILNYFGYQRFGITRRNHLIGYKILKMHKPRTININQSRIYLEALQSYLFNILLSRMALRGNLPNTLPIPGYSLEEKKLVELYGLSTLSARTIKKGLLRLRDMGLRFYGGLRDTRLTLIKPIHYDVRGKELLLDFALSRGQYATILLREIFKPKHPRKSGF